MFFWRVNRAKILQWSLRLRVMRRAYWLVLLSFITHGLRSVNESVSDMTLLTGNNTCSTSFRSMSFSLFSCHMQQSEDNLVSVWPTKLWVCLHVVPLWMKDLCVFFKTIVFIVGLSALLPLPLTHTHSMSASHTRTSLNVSVNKPEWLSICFSLPHPVCLWLFMFSCINTHPQTLTHTHSLSKSQHSSTFSSWVSCLYSRARYWWFYTSDHTPI